MIYIIYIFIYWYIYRYTYLHYWVLYLLNMDGHIIFTQWNIIMYPDGKIYLYWYLLVYTLVSQWSSLFNVDISGCLVETSKHLEESKLTKAEKSKELKPSGTALWNARIRLLYLLVVFVFPWFSQDPGQFHHRGRGAVVFVLFSVICYKIVFWNSEFEFSYIILYLVNEMGIRCSIHL